MTQTADRRTGGASTLPALTGIRLPLALWVVAHHISGPGRMLESLTEGHTLLGPIVANAWAALPVFFAISGFVLARAYAQARWTREQLVHYATARFGRIYPLYLLSLLVVLPFMWTALRTDPGLGGADARIGLVSNYLLLLQAWHWPEVNWNTPAWSLSCEMFFYVCAPLLVVLARRPTWSRTALIAVVACALPIAARLLLTAPPKPFLYIGDFMIGAAASGAFDRLRANGVLLDGRGARLYGPAGVAVVLLLVVKDAVPFMLFDTGVRIATAIIILGLACGGGVLARVLSSPLFVAGGTASYGIYILHVPLLWWWRYHALDVQIPPLLSAVTYVAVVIALAHVAHRCYERPLDRMIRGWAQDREATRRVPQPFSGWLRLLPERDHQS